MPMDTVTYLISALEEEKRHRHYLTNPLSHIGGDDTTQRRHNMLSVCEQGIEAIETALRYVKKRQSILDQR